MTTSRLTRLEPHLLPLCLVVACGVFYTGLGWGLPSKAVDPFLFGARTPASGLNVLSLAAGSDGATTTSLTQPAAVADLAGPTTRGADLDRNPLDRPIDKPVVLNGDLISQAEIIRRYRLFSCQPDEMITFMSLATMRPGEFDFDPRLYQYGGLWIYPVGLCLRIASVTGFVDLRAGGGGLAYYLDAPEAFGRFYIVARLYVMAWSLLGVIAVFAIARRLAGSSWWAAAAAIAFTCMPVVINASHEAKPHMPGFVLLLLAVLAAARWARTGHVVDATITGAFCGLALGMVLSTLPVLAVIPTVMILRRGQPFRTTLHAVVVAFATAVAAYAVTNPYVIYHLISGNLQTLQSNLGNSKTFYEVGRVGEGVVNVVRLIGAGASWPVALIGFFAVGLAAFYWRGRRGAPHISTGVSAMAFLLAVPAGMTAVQAALVAAGKPGEFGRFLLTSDVALLIAAVAVTARLARSRMIRWALLIALLLGTVSSGYPYLAGFVRDTRGPTSRLIAAQAIELLRQQGARRLILTSEPAPYGTPPVNLFDWPILLIPRGADPASFAVPGDVIVQVRDGATHISWADKPFEIRWIR